MATFRAEWGIIFGAERKNVAACAGNRPQTRPECSVAMFCAEMEYLFLRGKEKCSRLRGNPWPNPRGMLRGNIPRGMGYHFWRGKEKCSRLRGNPWPNPPGMFRGNIPRRNCGIFIPGRGLFGSCYFVWVKNSFKSSGVHSIASPPCFWSGQYLYLMFTPCCTSSST